MFSASQIVAHLIGDFLLQSDWMAVNKTKNSRAALAHVVCYSIPFLIFFPNLTFLGWLGIVVPHFLIDRFRLARFVVFAKNFIAPRSEWPQWSECSVTGYNKNRPDFLAIWLLIIADNTLHLLTNGLVLRYLVTNPPL